VVTAEVVGRKIPEGQLFVEGDLVLVGCGENTSLALTEVQMDGKKKMSARDFVNGYRIKSGDKLGS
jgi:methionyl-tRNA formyltransferase